jgi:hypothetical protein
MEADYVVASDDLLANPLFILCRADRINDTAPFVTGNQRVVCGNVTVDDLKVGGADRRAGHLHPRESCGGRGDRSFDQGNVVRGFYLYCFHIYVSFLFV